jgi:F-box protein, helicase, 18
VVRLLGITHAGRDVHTSYILANHILKFACLFCNSDKRKVEELDYTASITDAKARAAVRHYHDIIEKGTRIFLAKMDRKEIDATHDFYLKKFQLAGPVLPYDTILFDEGQDASPVMLDVFLSQKATKVIVGDVHQQIYGWRHAINALRRIDYASHLLTTSFRFNDHIAALAMECLGWKKLLGETSAVVIRGVGTNRKIKTRATIARTNLALLKCAIDTVHRDRSVRKIYFEGNINSYTYAADGASIYDVLSLYLDNRDRIRDPLLASLQSFDELEEYAEKSEDIELRMLIDIVETYGRDIPLILKKLTAMHIEDDRRDKADMIFSTLHRCKGMEYDSVTLTGDFISAERIRRLVQKENREPVDRDRLAEEINLAYVAVTRSRNFLDFPDHMFPAAEKSVFMRKKKKTAVSMQRHVGEQCSDYIPWTTGKGGERKKKARRGRYVKTAGLRLKKRGNNDYGS